jgi:transposase
LHLVCDGNGIPLAALLTAGQAHESTQMAALLDAVSIRRPSGQVRKRPDRVAADKGYDFPHLRKWLHTHHIQAVIPPRKRPKHAKPKRGRPVTYNETHYRKRNVVERCVGGLKEHRSLATRYDKLAQNYLTLVKLAFIRRYLGLLTALPD